MSVTLHKFVTHGKATALSPVQQYDVGTTVAHIRHRPAYTGTDIRRVANDETAARQHYIITWHVFCKADCRGQVAGIVNQYDIQPEQVAHQTGEEYRTVLTVCLLYTSDAADEL